MLVTLGKADEVSPSAAALCPPCLAIQVLPILWGQVLFPQESPSSLLARPLACRGTGWPVPVLTLSFTSLVSEQGVWSLSGPV